MKVEWSVAEDWLQWMQDVHIPEVLGTGCFEKHQLVKLLQVDEAEGPTYAIQYYAQALGGYNEYQRRYAAMHSKRLSDTWGNRYVDFGTLMQEV